MMSNQGNQDRPAEYSAGWEKEFDEEFHGHINYYPVLCSDIKSFIRKLLAEKDRITETTANDVHEVTKSQCADELEEHLHKADNHDDLALSVHHLIEKWRGK